MGLSALLQTLVEEREPLLNVVPLNTARHCSSRKEKLPCSSNTKADRESCDLHPRCTKPKERCAKQKPQ